MESFTLYYRGIRPSLQRPGQKIHALGVLTVSPLPLQALLAQLDGILTCFHFLHIMT